MVLPSRDGAAVPGPSAARQEPRPPGQEKFFMRFVEDLPGKGLSYKYFPSPPRHKYIVQ